MERREEGCLTIFCELMVVVVEAWNFVDEAQEDIVD